MKEMSKKVKEHAFSVELKSKEYVKLVTIASDTKNEVLIEGFLGELQELSFLENSLVEITGVNGTLRVDLTNDDLRQLFRNGNKEVKK